MLPLNPDFSEGWEDGRIQVRRGIRGQVKPVLEYKSLVRISLTSPSRRRVLKMMKLCIPYSSSVYTPKCIRIHALHTCTPTMKYTLNAKLPTW